MDKILIVEDAATLREVLSAVLENEGYGVTSFADAETALSALKSGGFSCILCDFKLPGKNGIDLLKEVRQTAPTIPFLLMTAYGSIQIAVEAMKLGANDFICKPFEPQTLVTIVRDVLQHRRIIDRALGLRARRSRTFLSQHPALERMLYQARRVAAVDSSVLITGESGTGKELLARFIHEHSPRANQHFIAINCAAMPEELLESEFFGHEAGAFTGATQTRIGVFEIASHGTIFLDEIGEMPPVLQVKLLRALQEKEIKRVGSSRSIKVNPRIIAATNHNIEEALASGIIRDDLFYRIAVITFHIPPLRDRLCDIELLTKFYLEYFSSQLNKELELDDKANELLKRYPWPGNARELENVIERAAILTDGLISVEHLDLELGLDFDSLSETTNSLPDIAQMAVRKAEIELITKVLNKTMGNKSKAAQLLGISYKTLLNKVKEYNIETP